ncbi:MAG: hypothetical protein O6948_05735 [Deltaproteobacteria bacterium]|nr:hypothetical protein [Deltaproteobacteria bacterium]
MSDSLATRECATAFQRIGHHVIEKRSLTEPLHLTAARLRVGMNMNGHVWAAAGDRQR